MSQPARPLTGVQYWEDVWRGSGRGATDTGLAWVKRSYAYTSLDRLLRAALPADPTRSCLELGSGPGRWLVYFHRTFGYRVSGVDYSETSCRLARSTLAAAGVDGTIIQGDFFRLRGRWDVVFSAGVVEHFDDPEPVLRAFADLVAPGGYLVTDVPNLTALNGAYRRVLRPETFETHRPISLAELRGWHRALGLEEVLATGYGSVCMTRVPADAFDAWPRVRRLWRAAYGVASGSLNQVCLALLRRGIRIDHPWISPHLLVVSRRHGAGG
jgi:SAM-dependent methyltransferase